MQETESVNKGLRDIESGKTVLRDAVMQSVKEKYGR